MTEIVPQAVAAAGLTGFSFDRLWQSGRYSGLGHLLTSYMLHKDLQTVTGYQATFEANDSYSYDGLGNILTSTLGWGFSSNGGASTANVAVTQNTYTSANRLASRQVSSGTTITTTTYTFDAGNVIFESSNLGGIDPISDERASYYGADDKLLAVDWRVAGKKKVEEFRYDPLGRRVWVRYIPTCAGPGGEIGCVIPSVRRTIWDGAQELAEISAPADTTTPATEELDQGFPILNYVAGAGPYGDPNPHYGRVVYSPGLAVDQPLSVTRYEYHDNPVSAVTSLTWPRFTLMVFWDYRGAPAYGLFTDGAWAKPHTMGTGQTTCPGIGVATPQRCVLFQWPMAQSAYDRNRGRISFPVWHGSILQHKQSGTGLEYMRNRMYDPGTGRFTQEDPIGLAGGLNLYGFANGDPVNFSDPFGLRVGFENDEARQEYYRLRQQAFDAQFSDDKRTAASGRKLLGTLSALEGDDQLVTVSVRSLGAEQSHFFGSRNDGGEGFGIVLNRDYRTDIALTVGLAHESGHAFGRMVRGRLGGALENIFFDRAIRTENDARRIRGCALREGAGIPACK